jgi:hypothetical protein
MVVKGLSSLQAAVIIIIKDVCALMVRVLRVLFLVRLLVPLISWILRLLTCLTKQPRPCDCVLSFVRID